MTTEVTITIQKIEPAKSYSFTCDDLSETAAVGSALSAVYDMYEGQKIHITHINVKALPLESGRKPATEDPPARSSEKE